MALSREEGQADSPWNLLRPEAKDLKRLLTEITIRSAPDIVKMVDSENFAALTTFNRKFRIFPAN
jgi:hypothetical protein